MSARSGTEKPCDTCGKIIYVRSSKLKRSKRHYCSQECRYSKSKSVEVLCSFCGKPFYSNPAAVERRSHCSKKCFDEARQKPKTCADCGEILPRKSKGVRCANCYYISKRTRVQKYCKKCNKPISIGSKKGFCYPCAMAENGKVVRGEKHHNWRGGSVGYYGPNWNQQRKLARKRANFCCEYCGKAIRETKYLHVHHIKPFKSFGYIPKVNDHYKRANRLNNLVCLCIRHHRAVESGKITIKSRAGLPKNSRLQTN